MSQWAVRRGIQVMEGAPRLADGTLAGSSTPLSHCLNNVVRSCGVPLLDALIACTRTPAQLLGYPQKGRVMVGERADLVVFDEELSVVEARRGLVSIRG
jgi:N-acetylglucosamine-6-phosphate deacetylase